jgi:SCY1-like protein 1
LSFDCKAKPSKVALAKNAFTRLRTIRHPSVIRFLDGVEASDAGET